VALPYAWLSSTARTASSDKTSITLITYLLWAGSTKNALPQISAVRYQRICTVMRICWKPWGTGVLTGPPAPLAFGNTCPLSQLRRKLCLGSFTTLRVSFSSKTRRKTSTYTPFATTIRYLTITFFPLSCLLWLFWYISFSEFSVERHHEHCAFSAGVHGWGLVHSHKQHFLSGLKFVTFIMQYKPMIWCANCEKSLLPLLRRSHWGFCDSRVLTYTTPYPKQTTMFTDVNLPMV
jgi:hypothetical protein